MNKLNALLRHHVTGAIERGEASPIVAIEYDHCGDWFVPQVPQIAQVRTRPVYSVLAGLFAAWENCALSGKDDWRDLHAYAMRHILREHFPSGSGFDHGTKFDWEGSKRDALRFIVDYHHMDEYGGYDGWTSHIVTVRASLVHGIDVSISGRNRNGIKDYIVEVFSCLSSLMVEPQYTKG